MYAQDAAVGTAQAAQDKAGEAYESAKDTARGSARAASDKASQAADAAGSCIERCSLMDKSRTSDRFEDLVITPPTAPDGTPQ